MKTPYALAWGAMLLAHVLAVANASCPVQHRGHGEIFVDCSHLHLTSLPPLEVNDATSLDLSFNGLTLVPSGALRSLGSLSQLEVSHNALQTLHNDSFLGLEALRTLDLSYNELGALSAGVFVHVPKLQVLRLDHNQLTSLGEGVFQALGHLRHLDLANNHLQVLRNDTFSQLAQLTWLAVGSNRLERLQAGAMTGLNGLTHLDLSHNRLSLTPTVYPPRVFASLGRLQSLRLEQNDDNPTGEYPADVFNDLVSLVSLAIDTFYETHFGRDFAALRAIQSLDLSHNCKLRHLANTSLEGFKNSSLAFLYFDNCRMDGIELCTFCDLPSLKRLWVIASMWLPPNKVLESLYGLQFQNMTEIRLHNIGNRLQFTHIIDKHSARFLRNICVSSLSMQSCKIQRVAGNSLINRNNPFTNCIEHIDVSDNYITGDSSFLLKMLLSKGPLRSVSIQNQRVFSIEDAQCLVSQNFHCMDYLVSGFSFSHGSVIEFPTPPGLTYLNMSSIIRHFNPLPLNVTFPTAGSLEVLDLSYLGLANCWATLYGLENLKSLDLNGNYCYNISETAFDYLHSLTQLGLSNLGISQEFVLSRGWRLFQNLHGLERLDLSCNNLHFADLNMLRVQANLQQLDVSNNRFQAVPVNVENHGDLAMLDLSHNFLTTLTSSERSKFDRLADRHTFRLKLLGNPLECACFNLDMVQWLWHTSVSLDGEGRRANYTCTTESGEITSTERVMAQWMSHWRRCVGYRMFGVALSAFLLQMLAIVVAFIIVRSWPQLCYAWKAIRRLRLPKRHHFQRDAYVVYSDAQSDVKLACVTLRECLEDQYGVRLLLRDREELPGSVRAESIVQHIDSSWKVVLLVTREFSQDEWASGFTVHQAQRSITDTMPDRVIVVFLDHMHVLSAMPSLQLLLRMVPVKNVLHVQRHAPPQHPVWKTLADLITTEQ